MRDLAEVFLWIGITGAGIAVLCGIIAAVAIAIGAAGLTGGAVAVWIGGGMLSLTSGFSGQWMPAIIAGGALVAGLLLGVVGRPIMRAFKRRPKPEPVAVESPAIATIETTAPAPTTRAVPTVPAPPALPAASAVAAPQFVSVRTVASESIR